MHCWTRCARATSRSSTRRCSGCPPVQSATVEVLRAQGLAYVRFATENPELYRIATMGEWKSGSNVDSALASSAFEHMCAAVGVLMGEGVFPRGDAAAVALELWSAAHGVASLLIAKPHLPFGDAEAFTDRVLRAVFSGTYGGRTGRSRCHPTTSGGAVDGAQVVDARIFLVTVPKGWQP